MSPLLATLLTVLAVSLATVLLLLLAVVIDGLLARRYFERDGMTRAFYQERENERGECKLAVLYSGLAGDEHQFALLAEWYRRHGYDVVYVKSVGMLYEPERVARAAADRISELDTAYELVVFHGLSLGGRAAIDTMKLLRDEYFVGSHTRHILVLAGAPYDWRSVKGPMKYAARLVGRLPIGALGNKFGLTRLLFGETKKDEMEEGLDPDIMRKAEGRAKQTPFSIYTTQVRSFAGRPGESAESLRNLFHEVYFVDYELDFSVVDQERAISDWREAFGDTPFDTFKVHTTHCGIEAFPTKTLERHAELIRLIERA